MSNIWIYVVSCVQPASRPTVLCGRILALGVTIFSELGLDWGSLGECKAKRVSFIFMYTFQLMWIKFGMVLKQFMLNTLILFLSQI